MSTTVSAATMETAAAMESTAAANGRVTVEAAHLTACHSATSEATDGTASRESASANYWTTTSEPTIAGATVEAPTTVEAAASVPTSVKPGTRSDKEPTGEPARAVVAVRRARVRVVSIVAVGADRSFTDITGADSDADRHSLCARERR